MPEIDLDAPANQELLAGRNTQACEQLNAWISEHTRASREMGHGHFYVYWNVLFHTHNRWLMEQAAARRRRVDGGFVRVRGSGLGLM